MEVKVLWDTKEETWEPLDVIKADDLITVSKFVEAKGLVNKPYWKCANQYLKNKKTFLRLCRQVLLERKTTGPVYKFGVQVLKTSKATPVYGRKQMLKK